MEPNSRVELTVIVPVFNDEGRIVSCLNSIKEFFRTRSQSVKLLVVCDGSYDSTPEIASEKLKSFPSNFVTDVIYYPNNRGKGFAIREGMQEANGKYALFIDVDLAIPLEKLDECNEYISEECPVIVGSRNLEDSTIKKKQPLFRRPLGSVFSILTNNFLGLNYSDYTCGFKLFRLDVAKMIFSNLTINGFAFDAEILYLAKKFGFSVKEVPVEWRHDSGNEVSLLKSSTRMLRDIIKIRVNDWLGVYSSTGS